MLIKKLSERIFFLAEKLHLPVDTRWLHCNISRRYTFNNDSRGNGKTVMTGSASLDTCKSATRALDSENIEANVARGAFLFFAEVSILAVFHHLVALFGAHCIPRFFERAQAPWKFRDYSNPITIESSNVRKRVHYLLRLPFTRVVHCVRYKRVYLPFQPGIFYANVTRERNVSTVECIFARERWFDAVKKKKVRLWSLFLGRRCDNCVDNCK